MIHICVPLYNRNRHIKKLIWNINDILEESPDYVDLNIYDFGSQDIVLEQEVLDKNYMVYVTHDDPPFRIAKACQEMGENIRNGIIFFCDADSVLPKDIFKRIRKAAKMGQSFYCPIVSFEQSDGSIWTPKEDHRGAGNVAMHWSDFHSSGGWKDTEYIEKTSWGGHDSVLFDKLVKIGLKPIREIEKDHYTCYHKRTGGEWYGDRKKHIWD